MNSKILYIEGFCPPHIVNKIKHKLIIYYLTYQYLNMKTQIQDPTKKPVGL